MHLPQTFGQLKASGYINKSVRDEIRSNLISKLSTGQSLFDGIFGYDQTVIPDIERALLCGHNILFLGLRGQAKTRLARSTAQLLDEYIPIVAGSEINDNPFKPISGYAKALLDEQGDNTSIQWVHRDERYIEKLATPDVSVSDLIGDLDPIKAVNHKVGFDHEAAIHYGLIPRSNRSIFAINELPDLQARIQVSLLNILEENDLQIRGFKLKLPLDVFFIFTANPEDYTQRGNIITPLKDRIESQILTHYPENVETSLLISRHEARLSPHQKTEIVIPELLEYIIEQIGFSARESEYIDDKSGVSARMSIAARELLHGAVERRVLLNKEKNGTARLTDLLSIVPALTGKMELVFEGEQLGPYDVALTLINDAIQIQLNKRFPKVQDSRHTLNPDFQSICNWFNKGNELILNSDDTQSLYQKELKKVPVSKNLLKDYSDSDQAFHVECILHHIAATQSIQKDWLDNRIVFKDQLASMLNDLNIESN